MAGIYLHIPFCKKACHYCNFHFSTSLRQKKPLLEALLQELELQSDYLRGAEIGTVYFGGGTPSLLKINDLEQIFKKLNHLHRLRPDAEITLEANPDDLSPEKLSALRNDTPVNRLSIGIQSFAEEDLRWMNRAHSAAEAEKCLDDAEKAGFENLTVDLIYGTPTTSDATWADNLRRVFAHGVPHISCYCLTIEEGTALHAFVRKKQRPPMDEERAARQFEHLMDAAAAEGYEHYEISNFARPGCHARHNTAYWQGTPYLGVGPSAHSFNGHSRQWNVANNALYIKALSEKNIPFELENLTPANRYNEHVMTGLRTIWGCNLAQIRAIGGAHFVEHFEAAARPFLETGTMARVGDVFFLPRKGKLLADGIAAQLFLGD